MSEKPQQETALSTETAMNRVLEAEQTAKSDIAECEQEAARLLDASRQRARRITERADERIGRLHTLCAEHTEREVESMLRAHAREGEAQMPVAHEQEVLAAAVARLAARLSGADDEAAEEA